MMHDVWLFVKCLIDTWIFNSILLFQTMLPFTATNSLLYFLWQATSVVREGWKTTGSSSFVAIVLFVIDKYRNTEKLLCVNVYVNIYVCIYVGICVYLCIHTLRASLFRKFHALVALFLNSKLSLGSEMIGQRICMFKILIDIAKLFLPFLSQDGINEPTFLTKWIRVLL